MDKDYEMLKDYSSFGVVEGIDHKNKTVHYDKKFFKKLMARIKEAKEDEYWNDKDR